MADPISMISTGFGYAQQVYQVVMFIKQVVTDMRNYDNDKNEFELRLDMVILFLREFQNMVFTNKTGLIYSADLDSGFKGAIDQVIRKLTKDLSEYREAKQQYVDNDPDPVNDGSKELADGLVADAADPQKEQKEDKKLKWYKKLKKTSVWALFGKENMKSVVQAIEEWTEHLRKILTMAMQKVGWMKASVLSGSFEDSAGAKALGLAIVAKRQRLIALPPKIPVEALPGALQSMKDGRKLGAMDVCRFSQMSVAGQPQSLQVIVEYKDYGAFPEWKEITKSDQEHINNTRARIRALVTILQGCEFKSITADSDTEQIIDIRLNVLECLGYVEQERRAAIIYKFPVKVPSDSAITLQAMIDQSQDEDRDQDSENDERYNLSLGEKFCLAYEIALTVSNLHACGWVHKSIRSNNIVLFPPQLGKFSTGKTSTNPYLVGFEYARPESDVSMMYGDSDMSRNLYRHPNRQNDPTESFTKEHDLYAVGVVLLEIGTWRTVTDKYKKKIASKKPFKGTSIQKNLVVIAKELEGLMGKRYMDAVLACLNTDFDVSDDDEAKSALALAFSQKVLEPIKAGTVL